MSCHVGFIALECLAVSNTVELWLIALFHCTINRPYSTLKWMSLRCPSNIEISNAMCAPQFHPLRTIYRREMFVRYTEPVYLDQYQSFSQHKIEAENKSCNWSNDHDYFNTFKMLRQLRKTGTESQWVEYITYRYAKLSRAILKTKRTAMQIALYIPAYPGNDMQIMV